MFAGDFDRMTGLSGMLADGILSLSQNLEGAVVWAGSFATALGLAGTAMWAVNGGAVAFLATMISLRAVMITLGIGVVTLAIGTLVNYLLDATRETGSFSKALEQLAGMASEVVQRIGQGFNLMGEMIAGVGMGISAAFNSVWADILAGLDNMLNGAAASINTFLNSTGSFFNKVTGGGIEGNWGKLEVGRSAGVEAQVAAQNQAAAAREYMDSLNSSFMDLFTKPLGGGMTGSHLGTPFEPLGGLPKELEAAVPVAKTLGDELDNTGSKGEKAGKKTKDAIDGAKDAAEDFQSTLGSAFRDLITGASSFSEVLSQILGKLSDMFAEQAFKGIFDSSGAGGFLTSIFGALGFGGARANGGPVDAGKAYVVGEKRPEMFIPETSGTILPFVPRAQQSGGGEVVVRTYLDPQTGALDQKIERISGQSVRAAAPEIVGQSVTAVGAQNRRTRRYLGK